MAKSFLNNYSIGKDIIDNVEEENFPEEVQVLPAEMKEEKTETPEGETEEKTKGGKINVRKEGLFTVFETGESQCVGKGNNTETRQDTVPSGGFY